MSDPLPRLFAGLRRKGGAQVLLDFVAESGRSLVIVERNLRSEASPTDYWCPPLSAAELAEWWMAQPSDWPIRTGAATAEHAFSSRSQRLRDALAACPLAHRLDVSANDRCSRLMLADGREVHHLGRERCERFAALLSGPPSALAAWLLREQQAAVAFPRVGFPALHGSPLSGATWLPLMAPAELEAWWRQRSPASQGIPGVIFAEASPDLLQACPAPRHCYQASLARLDGYLQRADGTRIESAPLPGIVRD